MSANVYVGGANLNTGPTDSTLVQVSKASQLVNHSPSSSWVYVDEHPDSINDAGFFAPAIGYWYDLPGNYHNGASSIAFADGHSEIHSGSRSFAPFVSLLTRSTPRRFRRRTKTCSGCVSAPSGGPDTIKARVAGTFLPER